MSDVGKPERVTQNRVIKLFREKLGYDYLGDWQDRDDNSNIEEESFSNYLKRSGYSPEQITRAIYAPAHRGEQPKPHGLRGQGSPPYI